MENQKTQFVHLNTIKTPEDLDSAYREIELHVSRNGWDASLHIRWKKLGKLKAKFQK